MFKFIVNLCLLTIALCLAYRDSFSWKDWTVYVFTFVWLVNNFVQFYFGLKRGIIYAVEQLVVSAVEKKVKK